MAIGMYNRPMTEEEERMMMAQSLKNNNMMIPPTNYDMDMLNERSRGAELIQPGADMSQFNDVTGTMLPPTNYDMDMMQNTLPQKERISPMGTPMTPEQIDEEIMRLQMLKNQMMMGN